MKGRLLSRSGASSSVRIKREALRRSRQQETSTAESLGGARVSGSGNQWHSKGDVSTRPFLIECKRTDKLSYRLEVETLRKHRLDALKAGKSPLIQVEMGKEKIGILPWEVLLDLIERAGDGKPQVEAESSARRRT
jgi:hypothetical protein